MTTGNELECLGQVWGREGRCALRYQPGTCKPREKPQEPQQYVIYGTQCAGYLQNTKFHTPYIPPLCCTCMSMPAVEQGGFQLPLPFNYLRSFKKKGVINRN